MKRNNGLKGTVGVEASGFQAKLHVTQKTLRSEEVMALLSSFIRVPIEGAGEKTTRAKGLVR